MAAHGQLRQSQVITTYGPGALIDLPHDAAIVGGLETWPSPSQLDEIVDPRLSSLLQNLTEVPAPRLYAPPPQPEQPWLPGQGIGAWRFPEWFVVQEADEGDEQQRSRRLVHRRSLEKGRFEQRPVVPTRFVRACPRGHVDDLDWSGFVHGSEVCTRQLWLDERGTTGDLADLVVRCECRKSRRLYEATEFSQRPLGTCRGKRPWLGLDTEEPCDQPSRLLIRTATNAYFSQVVSVLSLPDRGSAVEQAVRGALGRSADRGQSRRPHLHQEEAARDRDSQPVLRRRGDADGRADQARRPPSALNQGGRARSTARCAWGLRRRRARRPRLPRPAPARERLAARRGRG